jgi:hypothetical protein
MTSLEGLEGGGIAYNAAGQAVLSDQAIGVLTTAMNVGGIGGGTLAAASSAYNAYVSDQNQAAAFSAAVKSLNGLTEYDRYRESIFLQVFSQTVDDPNKDADTSDLNGNGRVDDKVTHFLYWWDGRIKYLKAAVPTLESITDTFFNGTLGEFKNYIQSELTSVVNESNALDCVTTTTTGMLAKADTGTDTMTGDGTIAAAARALDTSFWNPAADGSFDGIVSGFNDFISEAQTIQAIDINQLTANWQTYIKNFYNEDAGSAAEDGSTISDYYTTLGEVKGYLSNWKTQITEKRNALPSCKMGSLGSLGIDLANVCQSCGYSTFCAKDCIVDSGAEKSSIPCKFDFTLKGGSLDYEVDDEITTALNDIDTLISKLGDFQNAIKQYVQDMENTYSAIESGYGGLNPAVYSWTDSRGQHSIKAQVGPYKLASTIKTESGNWLKKEICIRMVDYSDDGSNSWVQVTRQDPKDKDVKSGKVSLGMWNPFFSGKITKKGKSYYSYDKVGLAGN